MTTDTDAELRHLADQLRQRILSASIKGVIARARGYRSTDVKAELRRLGFTDSQCRVPAFLLPVWNVLGEIANYQYERMTCAAISAGKPSSTDCPAALATTSTCCRACATDAAPGSLAVRRACERHEAYVRAP